MHFFNAPSQHILSTTHPLNTFFPDCAHDSSHRSPHLSLLFLSSPPHQFLIFPPPSPHLSLIVCSLNGLHSEREQVCEMSWRRVYRLIYVRT